MGKPPIDPVRWQAPPVDPLPDFGSTEITVVPVPGNAPEDVVVDAILEARGRGSLFRRDPDGTVLTLVPGLYFANGLTLTADGLRAGVRRATGPPAVEVLADGAERGIGHPARGEPARHAR